MAIHDSAQFVPHEVHVPLTPLYLGSQYNSSSVPQDGQLPTPYSLELLCDSHLFTLEKKPLNSYSYVGYFYNIS